MTPMRYDVSDIAQLRCEFRTLSDGGVSRLADPTTVVVQIKNPNNGVTTYTWPTDVQVVRLSVGLFRVNVGPLAIPGVWMHRWRATGAIVTGSEQSFTVVKSAFSQP